jgi:hypothetical protein
VTEVAHVAKDRGQRSIYVASDLLAEEAVPAAGAAPQAAAPQAGAPQAGASRTRVAVGEEEES